MEMLRENVVFGELIMSMKEDYFYDHNTICGACGKVTTVHKCYIVTKPHYFKYSTVRGGKLVRKGFWLFRWDYRGFVCSECLEKEM